MEQPGEKHSIDVGEEIRLIQESMDILKTNVMQFIQEYRDSSLAQMQNAWVALGITVLGIAVAFTSMKEWLTALIMLIIGISMILLSRKIALHISNRKSNLTSKLHLTESEAKSDDSELKPDQSIDMASIKYKFYIDERKALVDASREQSKNFDKYILTLAAGTFGLSLLFIKQIVPNPQADTLPLLFGAWGAFCISIILTLISFLISMEAQASQIQILESTFYGASQNQTNTYASATKGLNWVSAAFFMVGVILLVIFSILNLL
jgi:hypothetical protein